MSGLRATWRGVGPYRGVVKDANGAVVVECKHLHPNKYAGLSALGCARQLLSQIDPPAERRPWDPPETTQP